MAKNPNQKLKLLFLMQMFMQKTDDENGLTMAQIISGLDAKGVKAERKSIYDDINYLREFGLDIITSKGQTTEYYIGSREFEFPELILLVDAVQCSKFLTEKKSNSLIKKLETLASASQVKLLQRQVFVAGRVKMQNESIFYNVDSIQRALISRKKISFSYYDYDVEKKKVARRDGHIYIVTPIGLVYIDDYYYLVTYSEKYEGFANYRVDRMLNIDILEERGDIVPSSRAFNISEYCQRKISMFGGEDTRVQLVLDKSLMNPLIDRFGKDVRVEKEGDEAARAYIAIASSGPFFGWLTQFGDLIRIDKPESLKQEFLKFLKKIQKQYK
jgi:predicted DNA-binding transcriptional regulator YafY